MKMIKHKVYAAMAEDIHQGFVWVPAGRFKSRSVVVIKSKSGRAYVEMLNICESFIKKYNSSNNRRQITADGDPCIVVSYWYRSKLGIETIKSEPGGQYLSIEWADTYYGKFMACIHHPQTVVRVSAWLAFISVFLGLIGVFLGFLSIKDMLN